jgi:DNA gyrase/topoisomerase IV subunit A
VSKRVDLLKTQTDLLSQYVKDEKDLVLQDKVKRALAAAWEELESAVKNQMALAVSVPKAIEPLAKERRRWDQYAAELKDLIGTATAASEAYATFRGALLDGGSGTSPLTRMLRAEAIRDLIFDDKFQERPGSSVVQLKLQRLAGTARPKLRSDLKEGFSGGVILSFVQYEPNGKLKNSGVHSAYTGFAGQQP